MTKVSVIIPVYNVEKYLRQCLDSIVNQTLKEIEIICVDDGSTDDSAAILAEYAKADSRVKVIAQVNSGTVIARKKAVDAAEGDYFLFVDPDDYLALNTCERLVAEMEKRDCDILQFGVEIHESFERNIAQRAKSQDYFNPKPCRYDGAEVFKSCYLRSEIAYNVIFRCFDGDLIRKAFKFMPEIYSINETDVFAFFFIAYFARKFVSIRDRFYHYRYGVGVSTKKHYSLDEFGKVLRKFDTLKVMKEFAQAHQDESPYLMSAYEVIEEKMSSATCFATFNRMNSAKDVVEAFNMSRRLIPPLRLVKWLASKYDTRKSQLLDFLVDNNLVECVCPATPPEHIGLFYFRMTRGGLQRVVSQEMRSLLSMGLKVTLFLEEKLTEDCFEIPEGVDVVYLPKVSRDDAQALGRRCTKLAKEILSRKIGLFYSHAYVSETMLWDVLVCKWCVKVPFILHYHNLFSITLYLRNGSAQFEEMSMLLKCVDGVVALSNTDKLFFEACGIRTRYLPNPVDASLKAVWQSPIGAHDKNLVLWLGRMSKEKQPMEALRVFKELHRINPEARMQMVGGGDPIIIDELEKFIKKERLDKFVELKGSQSDAYSYYKKASVFLSTSLYEGFPLTALETLCAGTPIVAYSIPHLELYRDNAAVVQVKQGDIRGAAQALHDMMASDKLAALRVSAKRFVAKFAEGDFDASLKAMVSDPTTFFGAGSDTLSAISINEVALLLETIKNAIAGIRSSAKLRRNESLIARGFECLRENGWLYTRQLFLSKVKARLFGHGV